MKRGWVLGWSVCFEMVVVVGTCLLLRHLPITLVWKGLIGIGGVALVVFLGFSLICFWWAKRNLFFTFIPEGRAKALVRGDEFYKALMRFRGYKLNRKFDVVRSPGSQELGFLRRFFGGLTFYGFWPIVDVYLYSFQWTGINEKGEFDIHPKETLDFILVKDDIYGCSVERAEDRNLLPLDVNFALTVRIINPYKALFVVQNWIEAVMNRVRPYARDFITTETYEDLIKDPARIGTEVLSRLESEGILDEFRNRYGIELRKVEVKDINPGEEYREATLAKYLAERERDRVLVQADAEKQRLKTVARGEEERIKRVYGAIAQQGELGKLIRLLESMEKSPEKGSKWIIPLPGMTELLSQIFSGRTIETLGPEEIKMLRGILEEFQKKSSGK